MNKSKKNSHSYSSDWKYVLIILGVVFAVLIFALVDWDKINTNTKEVHSSTNYEENYVSNAKVSNSETYCYNGDCYETYSEYSSAKQINEQNKDYEITNSKWTEHIEIIENDAKKTNEAYNSYCVSIDMSGVPTCVNTIYPRLEVYATHIANAQNFMLNQGSAFDNRQKLLANLDEHSVYVKTIANNLDSAVNQYNSWVASQQQAQVQAQQNSEMLSNILKILAMGI